MLFLLFLKTKSIDYSLSGTILTISGDGWITSEGVRSKGNFRSFTKIIIKDGPTKICTDAFLECRSMTYLKISKTVTLIEPCFSRCWELDTIEVDTANEKYISDTQGLLCTKDHKILIRAPNRKNLIIEEGIESIEGFAFATERTFDFGDIIFPTSLKNYKISALTSAKFGSVSFRSPSKLTSIPTMSWSELDTLTIPSSVIQIIAETFTSTTINTILFENGSNLQIIGEGAFKDIKITEMTLPDSIKEINDNAFLRSTLQKLTIGINTENISNNAFTMCESLSQIIISPQNNHYSSFDGVIMDKDKTQIIFIPSGKKELRIASTVKGISRTLLQGLKNIDNIILEESNIWSTENGVLYSKNFDVLIAVCGGVKSITAHKNLVTVGEYAAYNCNLLGSFSFGESQVTSIKEFAFYGSGLQSLDIPLTVSLIKSNAFQSSILAAVDLKENSQLESIEQETFKSAAISSIRIPKSVISIGLKAFYECKKLETILFSTDSVIESIKEEAFVKTALTALELPLTVQFIENDAFMNCFYLKTVIFKEGSKLETIGNRAFYSCSRLWKVELPKSCHKIGLEAFKHNAKLSEFKHSLTTIGNTAFSGCLSLSSFNFSATQTQIDPSAFQGCSNLKNYFVSEANEVLMSRSGCVYDKLTETKLILFPPGEENAYISVKIVEFSDNAFAWSPKLTMVAFYSGSHLETIGNSAFYECKCLTIIQFPPRLRIIKEMSFYGCSSIQLVNFPDSLESIEDNAFAGCKSLNTIKYCGTNTVNGSKAFDKEARVLVTDLYPTETFCSIGVDRKLSFNCEMKPQYEKTYSCRRILPTSFTLLVTTLFLYSY